MTTASKTTQGIWKQGKAPTKAMLMKMQLEEYLVADALAAKERKIAGAKKSIVLANVPEDKPSISIKSLPDGLGKGQTFIVKDTKEEKSNDYSGAIEALLASDNFTKAQKKQVSGWLVKSSASRSIKQA